MIKVFGKRFFYLLGVIGSLPLILITWLEARRRAFNAKSTLIAVSNLRLQNRIALYLALGGDFATAPPSAASKTKGAVVATTTAAENTGTANRRP